MNFAGGDKDENLVIDDIQKVVAQLYLEEKIGRRESEMAFTYDLKQIVESVTQLRSKRAEFYQKKVFTQKKDK